jgi:DNA polymerase V
MSFIGQSSGMVLFVDCNSFYVSCEKVFNPNLEGKPVVVLSNNDGCVVSCSAEAKKLNIRIGTPYFECAGLIKMHGGVAFSSNYTLYGDMSQRVMDILSEFSPDIEIYSIDEAFLSLNGMNNIDLLEYGHNIKTKIKQYTGIPVSVGIAQTKTLAKIANRFCKTMPSLNGVYLFDNDIDSVLEKIFVEDIWGIGFKYSKLLNQHGIRTALQLKNADDSWIKKKMTITGLRTVMELRGIPCIGLDDVPASKKCIMSSRSFGKPVESIEELKEAIAFYTSIAAAKLRDQKSVASVITVYLMTDWFKANPHGQKNFSPYYRNSCTINIPTATSYTPELIHYGNICAEKIYKAGYRFKKAGVILNGIFPEEDIQPQLFEPDNRNKISLMHIVDEINKKYGSSAIKMACFSSNNTWEMRRDRLSQRYTTRWDELLTVG